jgi:mitochondrial chaperone BCS1
MTTNHPEKLDEALIRPGRVDHQVAFGNATQLQVQELFERMYTNDLPRTKLLLSAPTSPTSSPIPVSENETFTPPLTPIKSTPNGSAHANGTAKSGRIEKIKDEELSADELSGLAAEFAKVVPDDMFSPAEIQGFLLKRKKEPRRAVLEVGHWVEGMREVKRRGGKVVSVQ